MTSTCPTELSLWLLHTSQLRHRAGLWGHGDYGSVPEAEAQAPAAGSVYSETDILILWLLTCIKEVSCQWTTELPQLGYEGRYG